MLHSRSVRGSPGSCCRQSCWQQPSREQCLRRTRDPAPATYYGCLKTAISRMLVRLARQLSSWRDSNQLEPARSQVRKAQPDPEEMKVYKEPRSCGSDRSARTSWSVRGRTAGPAGTAGLSGYQIVSASGSDFASSPTVVAYCPAGKKVVGHSHFITGVSGDVDQGVLIHRQRSLSRWHRLGRRRSECDCTYTRNNVAPQCFCDLR